MSQIKSLFQREKKAVIPYITFADPNPEFSLNAARAMFDAGADIIELGIPFSDPIADGPVIQASHQRALKNGHDCTIDNALEAVKTLKREYPQKGIAFMLATNLVMQYGADFFMHEAQKVGLDAVIIPDLPFEMSVNYQQLATKEGVDLVQLMSPLCTDDRIADIAKACQGFLYLISSTGITGERSDFSATLSALVDKIKTCRPDLPVAVGFGISSEDHVRDMTSFADAVIVGSHLVKIIETHPPEEALVMLAQRVSAFKQASR